MNGSTRTLYSVAAKRLRQYNTPITKDFGHWITQSPFFASSSNLYQSKWLTPVAGALLMVGTTAFCVINTTWWQDQPTICATTTKAATQCRAAEQTTTSTFQIKQSYDIQQVLGEGAYGIVFEAVRRKDGLPVALKAITRKGTPPAALHREVSALQLLSQYHGGHPHVCQFYDLHSDDKYYYLVMELIQGGELLDHLLRQGRPYSEQQAAGYLRQFAEAIHFVHMAGYTHADLKLENLLLSQPPENIKEHAQLKVVDFGCAVRLDDDRKDDNKKKTFLGTVAYWPPEFFGKGARPSPSSDMWAAGCIVYILVTGTHPFDKYAAASDKEIVKTVKRINQNEALLDQLVFDERTTKLSDSCLQLIKGLMNPDPAKRMTSEQFLRHPWVQGMTASWGMLSESYQKLEGFWQKRFRDEIIKAFSGSIDFSSDGVSGKGELSDRNLAEIFESMDLDGNGRLELEEVQKFFQRLGFRNKDIKEIFDCADLDGTGVIHFDEFQTLMRKRFNDGPGLRLKYRQQRFRTGVLKKFVTRTQKHSKQLASDRTLREMFDAIDLDRNGVLDAHEIRLVLRAIGEDDEETISRIVASVDLDHDGGVSWEEFQEIMRMSSNA